MGCSNSKSTATENTQKKGDKEDPKYVEIEDNQHLSSCKQEER